MAAAEGEVGPHRFFFVWGKRANGEQGKRKRC